MFHKVKEKQEFTRKTPFWDVSIHFRSLEDIQNHGNTIKQVITISTNRLITKSNYFSGKHGENKYVEHQEKAVLNQIKTRKITPDSPRSSISA